jgi:hypothetical protein
MHACIRQAVVRTRMLSRIQKRIHHKHGSGNDLSNNNTFPLEFINAIALGQSIRQEYSKPASFKYIVYW